MSVYQDFGPQWANPIYQEEMRSKYPYMFA